MVVPAPGLFSITTGWPSALESDGAMTRAVTSLTPPGGKFTTIRIGLVGQAWAHASAGTKIRTARNLTTPFRSRRAARAASHRVPAQSLAESSPRASPSGGSPDRIATGAGDGACAL